MSTIRDIGKSIPLTEGSTMTAAYRAAGINPTNGTLLGANIINQILGEPNVEGIRFYYAKDATNNLRLVLVGVDANGDDITSGTIADNGKLTPPFIGTLNPLNS